MKSALSVLALLSLTALLAHGGTPSADQVLAQAKAKAAAKMSKEDLKTIETALRNFKKP